MWCYFQIIHESVFIIVLLVFSLKICKQNTCYSISKICKQNICYSILKICKQNTCYSISKICKQNTCYRISKIFCLAEYRGKSMYITTTDTHTYSPKMQRAAVVIILCLSPLKLWVQIPLMVKCTRYKFMRCLSVTCSRSVVFSTFLHQ